MRIDSDYSNSALYNTERLLKPRVDQLIPTDGNNILINSDTQKAAIVGSAQNLGGIGAKISNGSNEQEKSTGETETTDSAQTAKKESDADAVIAELKGIEREVIAHEAAHKAVAGGLGGAASFSFTTGPDGRKYITGGEVQIRMPLSDDPKENLKNAEQVIRAALAPAKPSAQDMSVAAHATQVAVNARAQVAAERSEELSESEELRGLSGAEEETAMLALAEENARIPGNKNSQAASLDTLLSRKAVEAYSFFSTLPEGLTGDAGHIQVEG